MTPLSRPPDFAPYLKPALAQVTKLSIVGLGQRAIALVVAAGKSNIPKLFFIKIGKRTKGSPTASPSHKNSVQSEKSVYRPQDNVVFS